MTVSGIGGGSAAANYLSSPAVRFAQLRGSSLSTLFTPTRAEPSDLTAFTSTAVSSALFRRPGLLTGLTRWDGSMTPGSQRSVVAATTTPVGAPTPTGPPASPFTFNPFDESSWGTPPSGGGVDVSA